MFSNHILDSILSNEIKQVQIEIRNTIVCERIQNFDNHNQVLLTRIMHLWNIEFYNWSFLKQIIGMYFNLMTLKGESERLIYIPFKKHNELNLEIKHTEIILKPFIYLQQILSV